MIGINMQVEHSATTVAPRSHHDRTLRAIRRIIRAVDLFSRRLEGQRGVTVPQLSCLMHVVSAGALPLTTLAHKADLAPSTAVGIVDRLERKGLVTRTRSDVDRRQVVIKPTPAGVALVTTAPSPLQDRLSAALEGLPELEQASIALSLERVVGLMDIAEVDASAILHARASMIDEAHDEPHQTPD